MIEASKLLTIQEQLDLFSKILRYIFMRRGFIDEDPLFLASLENDLKQVIETEYQLLEKYFEDVLLLPVFLPSDLESMLTVTEHGNLKVLSEQQVETLGKLLLDILLCVTVACRSMVVYLQRITEAEKISPRLLVSLLKSFGLHEKFFKLPLPVLRKLLRTIVHIYKYKGTPYSVKRLMEIITFAPFSLSEFYSFAKKPYNHWDSLYFMFLRDLGEQEKQVFELHHREVTDVRWWLLSGKYSDVKEVRRE